MTRDDTFRDQFRTQDEGLTALVTYQLTMPAALWFVAQVADALVSMEIDDNWIQGGAVTVDDATQAAQAMNWSFQPMIGFIFPVVLATLPANMLPCDGTIYLRADYPTLYAALDSAFIVDADHFITPDLRDRVIYGASIAYAPGATLGEAAHTLTIAEMPAHSHDYSSPLPVGTAVPPPLDASFPNPLPTPTSTVGGGAAHNNIQPSYALAYGIVAQ